MASNTAIKTPQRAAARVRRSRRRAAERAVAYAALCALSLVFAVPFLWLLTTSLTGLQWLECVGLALALPMAIEVSKWIRRRRAPAAAVVDAQRAVTPGRAISEATR